MHTLLKLSFLFLAVGMFQNSTPLDRIWQGGSAAIAPGSCELTLVSWNIERGMQLQAAAAFLKETESPVILLQEVDMNARRTGNKNVAEHLALSLGLNYLFAAEFEELGQGSHGKPAYHGQALLTSLEVYRSRIIRFRNQTDFWKSRWYLPNWAVFQRRTGGRIALAVELGSGRNRLVTYNLHLESRESGNLRLRQVEEVIADAQRYSKETPLVLAGDLNTRQSDSPAVEALLKAGFRKVIGGEITTTHGTALDWIFIRGPIGIASGEVHRQVRASDHFPLVAKLRIETPDCR